MSPELSCHTCACQSSSLEHALSMVSNENSSDRKKDDLPIDRWRAEVSVSILSATCTGFRVTRGTGGCLAIWPLRVVDLATLSAAMMPVLMTTAPLIGWGMPSTNPVIPHTVSYIATTCVCQKCPTFSRPEATHSARRRTFAQSGVACI